MTALTLKPYSQPIITQCNIPKCITTGAIYRSNTKMPEAMVAELEILRV